ncbi:MAG: SDR family NAD(P)-dependent oxidoreductase [Eubacteriales bacterium]
MAPKKTVLVTGATSGMGLETIKALIDKGYDVIGTSRSSEKEKSAIASIGKPVPFVRVDLASLKNQQIVANATLKWLDDRGLDVLVNNAGTFFSHHALSPEGIEKQFTVNTLAPLHLSLLLYDALKKASGRIVNVNSNSHYGTRVRWDDVQLSRHYHQLKAYKQTKLFSVMVSREFNKRSETVKTVMADPGLVNTEMGYKNTSALAAFVWKHRKQKGQTPAEGASNQIYLATEPKLFDFYYKYCKPKAPDKQAMDDALSQRMWDYCIKILGLDADKILGKA